MPAAKKAVAKVRRIKLTLATPESKLTTSVGVFVSGSVIEVPSDEADVYINRGHAHISEQDLEGEEHKLPSVPEHMRIPA